MAPWLLAVAACRAALPALPSQGGPQWHELTSMHFIVWTDASLERGREIVQRMEQLRSVIFTVAFPDLPPGGRTFVVALRDTHESARFMPTSAALAVTYRQDYNPTRRPLIVMPADSRNNDELVTHELVHAISYNAIHDQPHWFAEGLAGYFQTIRFDVAHGTVDVGEVPKTVKDELEMRGLFFTQRMFDCGSLSCVGSGKFYATAWSMYRYLRDKHAAELAQFQRDLALMPPHDAWHAVFPDLTPHVLDGELVSWLGSATTNVAHFKIEQRAWPVTERALSDADVYAVRALMLRTVAPRSDDISRDLGASLALDPTNMLARVVELDVRRLPPPPATARAIAAAHPDDFMAWWLVANSVGDGAERDAAFAKLCALIEKDPAVYRFPICAAQPR